MHCHKCGAEITANTRFCPVCGAERMSKVNNPNDTYLHYRTHMRVDDVPNKKRQNGVVILLIVVIVLLIALLTTVIIFIGNNKNESANETVAETQVEENADESSEKTSEADQSADVSVPQSTNQATDVDVPTPKPTRKPTPVPTPVPTPDTNVRIQKQESYLSWADSIEEYSNMHLDTAMAQQEINYESSVVFEKWDVLLNDVYKYLKTIMSEDEFDRLEDEELDWIYEKEAAMEEAASEFEGGSGESMARNMTGISYTKERCYYLISLIY